MKRTLLLILLACLPRALTQVPDNLVVEGVPPVTDELRREVGRYLEFRTAAFQSWHPLRREMLVTTRFADTMQLHQVAMPVGARRQLTFLPEPVAGGSFQPKQARFIVFSQDSGGGEFFQLFRFDPADARITLLTDGKSRNTGATWSRDGKWLAYTSTRRNGKDNDVYLMDPTDPKSDRLLLELSGGGWSVLDWSRDGTRLLLGEYLSINESRIHLADMAKRSKEPVTPTGDGKVSWGEAQFARDGKSIFVTTDKDSDFQRLCRLDLATQRLTPLAAKLQWDVEGFDLSSDGRTIAFTVNEGGASVLHLINADSGQELPAPRLPLGVISGLRWHDNSRSLGFTFSSAQSPADAYSYDLKSRKLERWTESETGGLNPGGFVEPEIVRLKSFDGEEFSALVYRPDARKFPGPRPVLVSIHGGPEAQARPVFQARNNYYLNELGIAIVYPNVRGSAGYGKRFLTLDNGFLREDSVKDIGTVLDWIKGDPRLDADRVAVIGGSYGGYMVLASMTHFSDRLRAGVDVVGISNFLTFLKNTQDYRRDLRRVEYGDERDGKMREFLEKISPLSNVQRIRKPLLVVQGKNDPRVPVTEAEQMVQAVRGNGGQVWYLMAKDEGHGFQKKKNADFQFLATIQFLREHLLGSSSAK